MPFPSDSPILFLQAPSRAEYIKERSFCFETNYRFKFSK
nr:MAG TPA: hypothetical protein [Caudoviricetes sp.]